MAKFLVTSEITNELKDIIKDADERLILISPFLKIPKRFKKLIEAKDKAKSKIRRTIVYKSIVNGHDYNDEKIEERNWLNTLQNYEILICNSLHAKCYLNEKKALITSMNLYEDSQDNREMGIIVAKDSDSKLYREILSEVENIMENAEVQRSNISKNSFRIFDKPTLKKGYCIRCKKKIQQNANYPYCKECYTTWEIYSNREWTEYYCHICGKENKSTINEPVCAKCKTQY